MNAAIKVRQRLGAAVWNPIVAKEVYSRMRTGRAPVLLIAFLTIMGTVAWAGYRSLSPDTASVTALTSSGTSVFTGLAWAALIMLSIVVPGLIAGTISGERERQTLDLLLCTPMRPFRIVTGKLIASLLYVVFLLVAALPIFSLVFLLGGVAPSLVVNVFLLLLMTAFVLGSLAVMCSVIFRRTSQAILTAFILVALLYIVPSLTAVFGNSYYSQNQPGVVANVSPYYAMGITLDPPPPVQYNYGRLSGLNGSGGSGGSGGLAGGGAVAMPPPAPSHASLLIFLIADGLIGALAISIAVAVLRGPRAGVMRVASSRAAPADRASTTSYGEGW